MAIFSFLHEQKTFSTVEPEPKLLILLKSQKCASNLAEICRIWQLNFQNEGKCLLTKTARNSAFKYV